MVTYVFLGNPGTHGLVVWDPNMDPKRVITPDVVLNGWYYAKYASECLLQNNICDAKHETDS